MVTANSWFSRPDPLHSFDDQQLANPKWGIDQ